MEIFGRLWKTLLELQHQSKSVTKRATKLLDIQYEKEPKPIITADRLSSLVLGIARKVSISFENYTVAMNFMVLNSPLCDIIIGLPKLEEMRGSLVSGTQMFTLYIENSAVKLPFEHATMKLHSRREEEKERKKIRGTQVVMILREPTALRRIDLQKNFVGYADNVIEEAKISKYLEEDRSVALASKVFHLDKISQRRICECLLKEDVIPWSVKDLMPAVMPVTSFFEINDNKRIHNRPSHMAPRQNELSRKEIDDMLKAGIIVPAFSACSFPVVVSSKNDGKPTVCMDYRSLNRFMKADR